MRRIRDAELRAMSEQERARVLSELAVATTAQPNGELRELDAEITKYEQRRRMTSADMRDALATGRLAEDFEICQWLIALSLRERIASLSSRP